MTPGDLRIIAFLCHWCAYDGADAAGRARLKIPPEIHEVRVMCSGRVDAGIVMTAFESGADGVMVLGCRSGDCHYQSGNVHALRRILLLQAVLKPTRIDPRRMRIDWVSAGQAEQYGRIAVDMVAVVRSLGPLPRNAGSRPQT
jgi:coenzyme F420-reducing hydrogenase delta subunit